MKCVVITGPNVRITITFLSGWPRDLAWSLIRSQLERMPESRMDIY